MFVLFGGLSILTLLLLSKDPSINVAQSTAILKEVKNMSVNLGIMGLLAALFASTFGLLYSYRLFGPLYRLETFLEFKLLKKDPSPIRLRSKDELDNMVKLILKLDQKFKGGKYKKV